MDETPTANTDTYESCEQCGSPVDHSQRYCVVCGARRKHVKDPALKYMAGAGVRTRGATSSASRSTRRRGSASLGTALVIAVIPVAVALGLVLGHNDNGANAKLLSALKNAHGANVYVQAGSGSGASNSNGGGSSSSGGSKQRHKTSNSGNDTGRTLNTTKYGSFSSVASIKPPTRQQQQQGAQVVKHDQSDTNQSYVNQQKGLPNVISVP